MDSGGSSDSTRRLHDVSDCVDVDGEDTTAASLASDLAWCVEQREKNRPTPGSSCQ